MLRLSELDGAVSWCVVQTEPRKEALLASECVRIGLSAYWPRHREYVRANSYSADRKRPVMRSLFPTYIFGGYPAGTTDWRLFSGLPGQRRVLCRAGTDLPKMVNKQFLWELVGHEGELAHNLKRARQQFGVKPGQRVRVLEGPFVGLYAKLIALDDAGRIDLLLDILGGATTVGGMTVEAIEAA